MSDQRRLLRATVAKVIDATPLQGVSEAWPSTIWETMEEVGLIGIGIQERLGGSGGSLLDVATVEFEIGQHGISLPFVETTMLAGWLCENAGWEWTGVSETVSIAPKGFQYRRDGSSLKLQGVLRAVPWARSAGRVVVAFGNEDQTILASLQPHDYVVTESTNLAGEPRDTLLIEKCVLDDDRWQLATVAPMDIRRRGALARSIGMAGAMTAMLDLCSKYAIDRNQFGRPLERFQAVQHLLARLAGEAFIAVSCARDATSAENDGVGTIPIMASAIRTARAATSAARLAHQIHGAIGITEEYPLHRLTKRLWSWRYEYGTEAGWSRELAEHIRQNGGALAMWPTLVDDPRSPR